MTSSPSKIRELIVAFLDMVENHKMIVENSGLLTVAALKHMNVREQEDRLHPERRQHGCHHHGLHRTARPDPERPCLHRLRPASGQTRRAGQGGHAVSPRSRATSSSWSTTSLSASTETRLWNCASPLEAYGTDHKNSIMAALTEAGYRPKLVKSKGVYSD